MSRTTTKGFVYRQYTKDGHFLADYKSSKEAGEATGASPSSVVRAAHGERLTGGGYQWRKVKEDTPQENIVISHVSNIGYHLKRPIIQLNLDGTMVAEYPSIASASRTLGISRRSLTCALSGAQHTAGGFRWKAKETESQEEE